MGTKKNFVLDTNVILHDYKCIENFQENDIYLPIVVLEELDRFKKGNEQINYNAREFVRELDLLTSNDLYLKGASLGPGKGTLYVVTGDQYQEKIARAFPEKTADHRILSCTLTVAETERNKGMRTILVTKDVNLRMKARSLGIEVEDYFTDKVVDVDIFERSQPTFENIDPELIDELYSSGVVFSVRQRKYDDNLLLCPLSLTQRLFDRGGQITSLELRLADGADTESVKARLQRALGDRFRVLDRYDQQEDVFRIMNIEKAIAYIFLTFILLVACFNIIGSLSMLIIDKKDDVATLRHMGADDRLIERIFLFEGWLISTLGAVLGIVLGLGLCLAQQHFGLLKLGQSSGNFIIDAYPVSVRATDVVAVFVTVALVSFAAIWYPVRRLTRRLL